MTHRTVNHVGMCAVNGKNFPQRRSVASDPHPLEAVLALFREYAPGRLRIAVSRQSLSDPPETENTRMDESVVLFVDIAHDRIGHGMLVAGRHKSQIERHRIGRLAAECLVLPVIEFRNESAADPIPQIGVTGRILRISEHRGSFGHDRGIEIMESRRTQRDRAIDLTRRTPVAQAVRHDMVLGQSLDMIDPLLHLAVIFPKRILVIVIEVHIPRKLHDGRTPVGRRNAAQAAAGEIMNGMPGCLSAK